MSFGMFFDAPSVAIVIGGTIGATLMNCPLDKVIGAGKVAGKILSYKLIDPRTVITQMVEFSNRARREGILALEEAAASTDNPFLKKGIQLAVDGEDPAAIENILDNEIGYLKDRHKSNAEVFVTMATFAPAMGLIGTLIGLVGMLGNMSDPSSIGPAMAVAILTTFYGAVLANLVFNPIAGKVRIRSAQEVLVWELTKEGVLAISAGDNPRMVEQRLNAYLAPKLRKVSDKEGA
jgi:chemotaxis protein MotA